MPTLISIFHTQETDILDAVTVKQSAAFVDVLCKIIFCIATEKQENMLVGTEPVAKMKLSEKAKWVVEVLSDAMKLLCYIYDADFYELGDLYKAGPR